MLMCGGPMHIGGVYIDPQQALEILGAVGAVGFTTLFGLLFVRRARAARLRQIEGLENDRPVPQPSRRGLRAEDLEEEGDEGQKVPPATTKPSAAGAQARAADAVATPAAAGVTVRRGPEAVPAPSEPPLPPGPQGSPGRVLDFPVPEAPGAPKRDLRIVDRRAEPPSFPSPEAAPGPAIEPVSPGKERPGKERKENVWVPGLARTRSGWVSRLGQLFAGKREVDPGLLDEIEKVLLTADIGVKTSDKLLEEMRGSLSRKELGDPDSAWAFLQQRSRDLLASRSAAPVAWGSAKPFVLLVIGVNGSGKTTTIGKLAALLSAQGKKVILGAGDTFRAAAAEQLEIWGKRTGAPVVRGKEGADPSSVLFDAIKRATNEGFDVVIGDTAGRLHTKADLMEELQKVRRVIGKAAPGAPHETWLVIDSTSGQNAIAQAQIFTQAMAVSGIVLTKLDGTAKGGVILGIADQLQIPVRFIGIGERVEDLREFDVDDFVEALFERESGAGAAQVTGSP
jgi:fused signal recognition particle receptor